MFETHSYEHPRDETHRVTGGAGGYLAAGLTGSLYVLWKAGKRGFIASFIPPRSHNVGARRDDGLHIIDPSERPTVDHPDRRHTGHVGVPVDLHDQSDQSGVPRSRLDRSLALIRPAQRRRSFYLLAEAKAG